MERGLVNLLKEMLIMFNSEARVVPPGLQDEMCAALDRFGADWLLGLLESLGVDGSREVRQEPELYWRMLKHGDSPKMLADAVAKNKAPVVELRKKIVGLLRLFRRQDQSMKMEISRLPDNGGIYRLLLKKEKGG